MRYEGGLGAIRAELPTFMWCDAALRHAQSVQPYARTACLACVQMRAGGSVGK